MSVGGGGAGPGEPVLALLTHCVCVRGAGPGAQAAWGSLEPPGSHAGGKPRDSPGVRWRAADSPWAPRGAGERAEPGPHHSLDLSPALARASRRDPEQRRRRACCRPATRSETLQGKGPGETRCGQAFPAVVISTARSGWERERERSLFLGVSLHGTLGAAAAAPRTRGGRLRGRGGLLLLGAVPRGHTPRAGTGGEAVAAATLGPRVGCKERDVGVAPSGRRR